jgi:hypothetical protein
MKADNEKRWLMMLGILEEFTSREGQARVPTRHIEGPFHLGAWVANQKHVYRLGKLSAERIARLEALPGWVWKVRV